MSMRLKLCVKLGNRILWLSMQLKRSWQAKCEKTTIYEIGKFDFRLFQKVRL